MATQNITHPPCSICNLSDPREGFPKRGDLADCKRCRRLRHQAEYRERLKTGPEIFDPAVIALPNEEWRDIPKWEGFYAVSSLGRIFSLITRPGAKGGRILKACPVKGKKYLQLGLCRNKTQCFFKVHRLVALAFIGPRPKGKTINHINGIKTDNRAENLEYATMKEQAAHARRLGLIPLRVGEQTGSAKLTNEKVRDIKQRLRNGETQKSIGDRYGVCFQTVSNIKRGLIWKHVVI